MSNQKNLGWISIHRQIKTHWLWEEKRTFSKAEAWIDILLSANHTTTDILLGNELITVQRGSFITSEVKLMKRWKWSKGKVRAFLLLLDTQHMVYKTTDTKKTTLTVVKYEDYQDSKTAKGLRADFKQTSKRHQTDTNNNDNNDNNEIIKKIISEVAPQKLPFFFNWLEYRKGVKKEITNIKTLTALKNRLNKEPIDKCEWVINYTIENGYQGLFWDNYKANKQGKLPTDNLTF
tara:strand:+ start:212 stop:913 length:702 start_codon:yes stop_codon:yes gene_type:complete